TLRLIGIDHATGEDQLLRVAERRRAREALGATPARDDSEVDLRLAELRGPRRVAQVAAERELATAAQREAVHRRDRRLRPRFEQAAGLVAEGSPLLRPGDPQPAP